MESSVAVKAMLICQGTSFPAICPMTTLLSSQISVHQICLMDCETVPVKSFDHILLENTRTFYNNPINSDKIS